MPPGLLALKIEKSERIYRGRNSKVFRLTCSDGSQYVLKKYFQHPSDSRDRLGVEFSSLQFIREGGIKCVPNPLAYERSQGYALYEYIDGKKIPPGEVTVSDIDSAVEFLGRLKELRSKEESRLFPAASEACFSIKKIIMNVRQRFERLCSHGNQEMSLYRELDDFLLNGFNPLFGEIEECYSSSLEKKGLSYNKEIPDDERTLSPSDFGFHNSLRCKDGKVAFLDFEYFGWDDPAKMISDFLLHPAMDLSETLQRQFVKGIMGSFGENSKLRVRVETVFPLFGLKWCLILLNEFLPDQMLRRGFAMGNGSKSDIMEKQLSKARKMLSKVRNEYNEHKENVWENC